MTVTHPFDSPRRTLQRAKHHIRDLDQVVRAFSDGQPRPWSYVTDTESQAPNTVYKIRFHTPPPADAACIIFDAVNNLRATLDQIGYSAAIASGKTDPSGTNFPFGDDPAGVERVFKRNRAHLTLPPQIMDLFRSVEPYKDGSGQLLWAVNKLCNTKKHSKLVPTMITEAWAFTEDADGTPIGTLDDNWMPNEGELILMVVPPEDDGHVSGRFAFTVSVNSVDIIRDKPIVALLEGAVDSINSLLISAQAICQRLGFFSRHSCAP
jgi:hypothetical protein